MGIFDPAGDSMSAEELARRGVRQRTSFMLALQGPVVVGASVISVRMGLVPGRIAVAAIAIGAVVVMFAVPVLFLRYSPPQALYANWIRQIEARRAAGKPVGLLSRTFLIAVFALALVFAIVAAALIPLPTVR